MIEKSMTRILSSIITMLYLMFYITPMGFCATVVPTVSGTIDKPVLRDSAQPYALKLEGDISISKKNPKITLSLRNSDVQQVLRMFADKAGLNIIFHSSVPGGSSTPAAGAASGSGGVTMDLVNVPLNDAFKMVLQVSGLTYFIENNTIVVASETAAKSLNLAKQELMIIPVKYVDSAAIASFLNKNIFAINKPGLSNSEIAVTNPGSNEILIFGTKNDYLIAKKVVAQFDVKPLEQTFAVNHTTPKEMAELICNILFKNKSNGASGVAAGTSISSTTTSSSSSSAVSDISLGAGSVACQYNNSVTAGNLSSLTTNSLMVTYFAQRGTISIVGGSPQEMELVKEFIAKNDKKQPQAYLEISIIELSETGSKEFNNTWNVYSSFFSGGFNGGTLSNASNFPMFFKNDSVNVYDLENDSEGEGPQKILYSLSKYSGTPTITYAMSYLIKNGKARVLANPRIMITNGQKSTIDLSSDYVKTVTSQVVTSTYSVNPTIQRTYSIGSDEGIKVELVPFISPEGYVTLNIKPDYSTIKEQITTPNSDDPDVSDLQATLLQRRNLDLKNIRIKDGETLVIGGMIRETESKTISKLPFLGDLPGIGMLFRNTSNSKEKQELVIMLTPKIIKDTEDLVENRNTTL
ncbi:MAG: hypothetical protein PHC64_03035 [Candidatus Gastranaerophilales bacterium]|nr:hypothetical protein [Candidatus Gastranaerophilales bacterium]